MECGFDGTCAEACAVQHTYCHISQYVGMAVCFEQAGLQLSTTEKQKIRLVEKRLFSIPKRLF